MLRAVTRWPTSRAHRSRTALTDAYLSRLRSGVQFDGEQLSRWQAIQAVARMAEGVPRGALLDLWRGFDQAAAPAAAQAPAT
jgi:hypothetical protein